jgi:hypothetical protein
VFLIKKNAKVDERRCQKQPERQMSRRRSTFSQADVTRASRGAVKAGLPVRRVEIDATGKIVIVCVEDVPEQQFDDPAGFEERLLKSLAERRKRKPATALGAVKVAKSGNAPQWPSGVGQSGLSVR